MAAMNSFHKDLEVQVIYPRTKGLEFSDDLIIFSKDNKKSFEKFVKENKLQYRILFSKSAPYLHSSGKLHYKMNFALIE